MRVGTNQNHSQRTHTFGKILEKVGAYFLGIFAGVWIKEIEYPSGMTLGPPLNPLSSVIQGHVSEEEEHKTTDNIIHQRT